MNPTAIRRRRRRAAEPYYADLSRAPLLSPTQERELAARVAAGDPEARDLLVRANLRLVVTLARAYAHRGLPPEDLVAEGNLGLLRAAEGYDGTREVRFSTYATYWIKQAIRKAVQNQGDFVRRPAYTHTLLAKWRRAAAALAERLGRAPSAEEVGWALRLSPGRLEIAREALRAAALTPLAAEDGDDRTPAYEKAEAVGPGVEEAVEHADTLGRVLGRLDRLGAREARIVRLRYGLDDDRPRTLREVGQALGLTKERVRQIERDALAKLAAD